ncbi:flagellar basal-body rod protein FlgF [Formivibrio citricus]|uniref:Flagellar basal-body rod protein FlgF n=1 Tax=Formivibrio citricus TaxID=83765 RepID=A0A1I4ZVW8_9NEIS|nr:flagellar basal-body rod protein FlgF [Formivibrio citricus]SFN54384.1 flagellar basal-body rod protein FlgF [Formivibrio citricus]
MDRLVYTAMTGAKHAQLRQATVSHNLANATTTGFRSELAAFRAVPVVGGNGLPTRAFVVEQSTGSDMRSGPLQHTGNDMDVAVDGEGWIAVQTASGEAYTRNGELAADSTGLLKTRTGQIVVGESGPLTVPENTRVSIAPDGTVSGAALDNPTQRVEIGKIKLVNPPTAQLEKGNDGLFRLRNGQTAQADETVRLVSGAVEGSNVNAVEELVSMISAQRHYDLQLKMISNADQNARSAAQLISLNG